MIEIESVKCMSDAPNSSSKGRVIEKFVGVSDGSVSVKMMPTFLVRTILQHRNLKRGSFARVDAKLRN